MDGDGVRVVVVNSGVKHAWWVGNIGARRRQCAEAVAGLGRKFPAVRSLERDDGDAGGGAGGIGSRRCIGGRGHVITENARTVAFAGGLERGICGVRRLMYGSHASLRDDYEVKLRGVGCTGGNCAGAAGVYGRG